MPGGLRVGAYVCLAFSCQGSSANYLLKKAAVGEANCDAGFVFVGRFGVNDGNVGGGDAVGFGEAIARANV